MEGTTICGDIVVILMLISNLCRNGGIALGAAPRATEVSCIVIGEGAEETPLTSGSAYQADLGSHPKVIAFEVESSSAEIAAQLSNFIAGKLAAIANVSVEMRMEQARLIMTFDDIKAEGKEMIRALRVLSSMPSARLLGAMDIGGMSRLSRSQIESKSGFFR